MVALSRDSSKLSRLVESAPSDNPFDPEASRRIADDQIARQANDALIRGATWMAVMGLIGAAQTGALTLLGMEGFVIPMVFALFGGSMSAVIRELAKRNLMVGVPKYLACTAIVSMPTLFLIAAHFYMPAGAATYVNGPMPFLYFMLITLSGFMFDVRLTVTCGFVAALGFMFCAYLSFDTLKAIETPDPIMTQDLVTPVLYAFKSFMIVFSSVGVAAFTHIARKIILSTVEKAYERGNYRLLERIGKGGMGEVWLAEHNMLARQAAVKIIRSDAFGSQSRDDAYATLVRFEKEAQATAQLRSPHTIEIYDFGLAGDGTFYYVMEMLDGLDLETLVEKHGPQPAERVVYLLEQVCASLEEAHRAGLVHRDIKPANIFICRNGVEVDFVKVLDFGLVKADRSWSAAAAVSRADSDVRMTQNVAVGTPAYMPPEIVMGGTVDGRADLYSLGCVAFWLLTGTLLFDTNDTTDMVLAHVERTPDPVQTRTELDIPDGLAELVELLLQKDPDSRPPSAQKLRRMLADVDLMSNWTTDKRERWWATNMRGLARGSGAGRSQTQ